MNELVKGDDARGRGGRVKKRRQGTPLNGLDWINQVQSARSRRAGSGRPRIVGDRPESSRGVGRPPRGHGVRETVL